MNRVHALVAIMLSLVLFAAASAEKNGPEIATPEVLLQKIESADAELLIASPVLRNKEVAEAIAEAADRGVRVIVATSNKTFLDPQSYFGSLVFRGVECYVTSRELRSYNLIVDGRVAFVGPIFAFSWDKSTARSYIVLDKEDIARRIKSFKILINSTSSRKIGTVDIVNMLGDKK